MNLRRFVLFIFCCLGAPARAHDPGLSTAQVVVRGDVIAVTATFSGSDLTALHPPSPVTPAWISGLFEFRVATNLLTARGTATHPTPDGELQFELIFPRPADGGAGELRASRLDSLPPGHRQFVMVGIDRGPALEKRLLTVNEPTVTFTLPATSESAPPPVDRAASTFGAFFKLGVEHIWTGYDHLLFLFALLVVCTRFRSIVAIISCFTVAHSITLGLATLNVVNLPSRYTEPLIAASIVFVGVENLLRRGAEPKGRWALTFAFGLIHGFGFASVLRELGVGEDGQGLAMPLLSFNLGVEAGQIAVAAVALPIIWRLRKNEKFVRRGVPALSAVVVAAGLYWLLQRTVFA